MTKRPATARIDSPLMRALIQHARSVYALGLRDFKTRFGASYFGFLFGLLIPLAHIVVLLLIYHFVGRRAPIGTDVTLYLTSAVLPFVVWSYTHQKMAIAFSHNKPLLSFPIIRLTDIIFARAWVEMINAVLIVTVVYSVLAVAGFDVFVYDPPGVLFTLLIAYVLGVSTGALLGLISILLPIALFIGFLIIPLYWVASGVFFIPGALPGQVQQILFFFPLTHIIDFGRTAFYPSYISDWHWLPYVFAIITANLLLGLLIIRLLPDQLTAK